MTTNIPDHLIKEGSRGLLSSRVFQATAAFGVPEEDYQLCAEKLAQVVLLVVADELRAEGVREALTGLSAWLGDMAAKHPDRSAHHPLMQAHIERYATDHYPATEDKPAEKIWPKGIEDTSEGRCDAALSIRGADYRCDLGSQHEGWAHSSRAAEAIWVSGAATP